MERPAPTYGVPLRLTTTRITTLTPPTGEADQRHSRRRHHRWQRAKSTVPRPDAQIIVAKVASDKAGSIPDSTVWRPLTARGESSSGDSVNLSLGEDAGMGTEAGTVYAEVYKSLASAGVTIQRRRG